MPEDPPFHTAELTRLAAPAWGECTHGVSARIPNVVHQPWLHGTQLRWEHILGMISVRWIAKPDQYVLYFDRLPRPSAQWECACELATQCVRAEPPRIVPGTRHQRLKMMHWPDMMRLDLLLRHGGIFLDHDAYVLRSLDPLRHCCPPQEASGNAGRGAHTHMGGVCQLAPVVAGFEQATPSLRKLNPGVLLAEQHSPFLSLCRASWRNYSTLWDYNCCEAAYQLHMAHPELRSHLRADIGPLPRYPTAAQYASHLRRARVVSRKHLRPLLPLRLFTSPAAPRSCVVIYRSSGAGAHGIAAYWACGANATSPTRH